MKNENIKTILFIFLVWLAASFFWFGKNCLAEEKHLILSEILPNPSGLPEKKNEFIEIYNATSATIDLADYYFSGKAGNFTLSGNIEPNEYKAFYSTITLYNEKSTIKLLKFKIKNVFDATDAEIDSVTYPNPTHEDYSYSFISNLNTWAWILPATPNNKNGGHEEESDDPPIEKIYSDKIIINELLPAPSADSGSEEFIELYNPTEKDEDLSGWILRDGSKTGKYTFPEKTTLKSKDFLVVVKTDFKFALNNSGGEKVSLFDPAEKVISTVEYTSSAKADYTYAFDGSDWQWTSKITRGAENEFDKLISGKIKKDDRVYANVYANFEANVDKKAKHFTWDFGDGHKSYLQKTRHKYEETGTYEVSLKITGDGKENLISFEVEVEKFGKAKIKIVGLSANPKGSDSDNEWLEIQNKTKKKIDLTGWSVATGWKNLYNHPITKNFILKASEVKKLTREFCAFTLGNKQAKIELRYPDGKVADKIKYNRKDNSISEDELYQKTTTGWDWTTPEKEPVPANEEPEKPVEPLTETPPEEKPEEINTDIDLSLLGKSTENPAWREKQKTQIVLLFAKSNVNPEKFLAKNQGRVLGISTAKFAPEKTIQSVFSLDFVWKKINARLNWIINSV